MVSVILIRHAKSARPFEIDQDSPLSDAGRAQAAALAEALARTLPARAILSSPQRRARQTAEPLAARWRTPVILDAHYRDLPVPADFPALDPPARRAWLAAHFAARYGAVAPAIEDWRRALLARLRTITADCLIFTHYLNIALVHGHCHDDSRVDAFAAEHGGGLALEITADGIAITGYRRHV